MRRSRSFDRRPESVARARHFVTDLLSDQPREIVEAAELMVSELATNSVRHAHSDFEVAVHRSRDELRVEVSDHGQGQPVLRSPTLSELTGRGLRIVEDLSEDWGITPSPGSKVVWFTLRLRAPDGEHESRSAASTGEAPESGGEPGHRPEATHQGPSQARIPELRTIDRRECGYQDQSTRVSVEWRQMRCHPVVL
jgi:anti-sigma regulatory factor (Ser/Thr protein kinase)